MPHSEKELLFFIDKHKSMIFFLLACFAIVVSLIFVFFFYRSEGDGAFFNESFKCPDEYKTSEEYVDSVGQWIRTESDKNPKASNEEIRKLRDEEFKKHNCNQSPWAIEGVDNDDIDEIMEAIKYTESQEPPKIGTVTEEKDIYNNPYIKHIRSALNEYLNGTNIGIEMLAIDHFEAPSGDVCGHNSFDKSYYSSKFIIFNATDGDFGGVHANIVFVDKIDTIFWVWVYRYGEDGEYVLRAFCENGPSEERALEFKEEVQKVINASEYFL